MENAVDALKIGFAMLVFVMALSIAIYALGEARETSDFVIAQTDPMKYVEYTSGEGLERVRTVGLETIIPSLYKYYKEDYMVAFQDRHGNPYVIYKSQTNENLWSNTYKNLWNSNYDPATDLRFNDNHGKDIACFDVEEETARREPWTASADVHFKRNLDAIISGETFTYPDGSGRAYNYGSSAQVGPGGLIQKLQNKQFDEYIGESTFEIFNEYSQMMTKKTKRVIIYKEK